MNNWQKLSDVIDKIMKPLEKQNKILSLDDAIKQVEQQDKQYWIE